MKMLLLMMIKMMIVMMIVKVMIMILVWRMRKTKECIGIDVIYYEDRRLEIRMGKVE